MIQENNTVTNTNKTDRYTLCSQTERAVRLCPQRLGSICDGFGGSCVKFRALSWHKLNTLLKHVKHVIVQYFQGRSQRGSQGAMAPQSSTEWGF